jgi:hypothetical protein
MSKERPVQTGKRLPTRVGGSAIRSRSGSTEDITKVRACTPFTPPLPVADLPLLHVITYDVQLQQELVAKDEEIRQLKEKLEAVLMAIHARTCATTCLNVN